jgi:DNA-directed RNA polymerase subunit RPC12/RpoP
MEVVRKSLIRRYSDLYCAMCGKNLSDSEFVIANTEVIPTPYVCLNCAEEIAELLPELREMTETQQDDEEDFE